MSSSDKTKREGKKKNQDDYYLDFVDSRAFESLKSKVNRLEEEIRNIKAAVESAASDNEILQRELNKKDVTIDQMAAEIQSLKAASREMGER